MKTGVPPEIKAHLFFVYGIKCVYKYFDTVNFPFLDGDVPRRSSYGVCISQLFRFAGVSNHVTDFNVRSRYLTAKLLQQDYRYHHLRKTFYTFHHRLYEFI